jgi:hypothetical protein
LTASRSGAFSDARPPVYDPGQPYQSKAKVFLLLHRRAPGSW